jgi:hypothetical protein
MAGNKAVAYIEPDKVELQTIDYPQAGTAGRSGRQPRQPTG